MIVTLVNEKGGAGKTTLATNLACEYTMANQSVLLVDADPQGTATDWYRAREAEGEVPLTLLPDPSQGLDEKFPALASRHDVVLIDTPGTLSGIVVESIKASTLALLPVQPSAPDLWAMRDTTEVIQERRLAEGSPMAVFVVSAAKVGTRLTGEVDEALRSFPFPVLEARTHNREAYKKALGQGKCVQELQRAPKATKEVTGVAYELSAFYYESSAQQ
jgi:chromosome partitioning protein